MGSFRPLTKVSGFFYTQKQAEGGEKDAKSNAIR